jgi:hypothetical protein
MRHLKKLDRFLLRLKYLNDISKIDEIGLSRKQHLSLKNWQRSYHKILEIMPNLGFVGALHFRDFIQNRHYIGFDKMTNLFLL